MACTLEKRKKNDILYIKRNAYRIFVGMPGKRPLGRSKRQWDDNLKMDFMRKGWVGMDWIHLVQDRDQWQALVNMVINL
jgi:hypothetical protein